MSLRVYGDKEIIDYSISVSTTPSRVAEKIEKQTQENIPMSVMLSGKMEGSLLGLLTRVSNAKRVLEFGTYTAYSTLVFAENLPDDGEVHTIDINKATVDFGLKIAAESKHFSKIVSHIGEGVKIAAEIEGNFDIVFIDADKENYLNYFKLGAQKLNPGGLIILDNALWSGKVLDEKDLSPETSAIKEVNHYLANNEEFYKTLIPVRDGVFIAQKLKF